MKIVFDLAKRERTLVERGLDFEDAALVFDGTLVTLTDVRIDYGEPRFQTFGMLRGRLVMVVWTPVPAGRRIISMRKANEREKARIGGIAGKFLG